MIALTIGQNYFNQKSKRGISAGLMNFLQQKNGGSRARTCDNLRVMQVLSQLSYVSINYIVSLFFKNAIRFAENFTHTAKLPKKSCKNRPIP